LGKTTTKNLVAPAKRAVDEARKGNVDAALELLSLLASSGDAGAAASVAEILAYRGAWKEMVPHALALLAKPSAARADAVFVDMMRLVVRASHELADPAVLKRAEKAVPFEYEALKQSALHSDRRVSRPPERNTHRADFEAAQAAARAKLKSKPSALEAQLFDLAVGFGFDDEVIARWATAKDHLGWTGAVAAARAFAKRGDQLAAWGAIKDRLPKWEPVDSVQIAPVVLLVDARLSRLMSADRCAEVLATPRAAR
jgi:hypothetical protein